MGQLATAQTLGSNPNTIDWRIIKTPSANIIYAEGMDTQAQRVANLISYLDENNRVSIGDSKRKIDLLIQNRTVIPNGYVALAPFRSEFYATPPQSTALLGSMNWLDVLTIHEYRHALQMMNMKRGLAKLVWFFTGDSGLALAMIVAIPNWFFEGDAVVSETALSKAGRGRTPDFMNGPRAMFAEGIDYSYMKWRNGSFKEYVPDHYRLGYMMLSQLRNEYGSELSGEIVREGASWRRIIYPYSRSMQYKTGLHTYELFDETWENNRQQWISDSQKIKYNDFNRITEELKTFTNYHFPQNDKSGKTYAVKESFKETAAIVQLGQDKTESKLVEMGINLDHYFDMDNGRFIWTEFSTNGRRNNESYSNIILFENGKKKQLTKKGKYFSPVFFEKVVFAIHIDSMQISRIDKLSVESAKIVKGEGFQRDQFISRLCALEENEVAYLLKEDNNISIEKLNLKTNKKIRLLGPTAHTIDGLEYRDGRIYFTASFSGIDNIYSIKSQNGQDLNQLTSVKISAGDPDISADGKALIYNQFSTNGKYVSTSPLQDLRNRPYSFLEPIEMEWQDKVAAEEEGGNILEKIPSVNYESKHYNGLMRGMKLHSWGLIGSTVQPSVRMVMNNILDDASLSGSVGFNRNENQAIVDLNWRIARFFPIFDVSISNAGRRSSIYFEDNIKGISFNETAGGISLSVPWNKLKGNYSTTASISLGTRVKFQQNLKLVTDSNIEFDDRTVLNGEINLLFSKKRRTAIQNLRPKFGFDFTGSYKYQFLENLQGRLNLSAGTYLPGLNANHSLYLSAGILNQETSGVINPFIDDFQYARGQNSIRNFDNVGRFSIDYAFPLFYPDWGFGGIVYFKRVKMNVFYDASIMRSEPENNNQIQSTGMEIIVDNVFFNFIPFPIGLQIGYSFSDIDEINRKLFFNIITSTNF